MNKAQEKLILVKSYWDKNLLDKVKHLVIDENTTIDKMVREIVAQYMKNLHQKQ